MKNGPRAARALGCALAALLVLLTVLLLVRGFGALVMGGLEWISDASDAPVQTAQTAQPTMPPLEEEEPAPEEELPAMADPVELPILATPEQLAEIAVDLTPPPDAPVG